MAYRSRRLPSRFPVGTKFVIESQRKGEGQAQIYSRHLEFPDGTLFPLPARPALAKRKSPPVTRSRARSTPPRTTH